MDKYKVDIRLLTGETIKNIIMDFPLKTEVKIGDFVTIPNRKGLTGIISKAEKIKETIH